MERSRRYQRAKRAEILAALVDLLSSHKDYTQTQRRLGWSDGPDLGWSESKERAAEEVVSRAR